MMIFIVWGKLKNSAIMVNKDALLEYERLKQKNFFTKKKAISGNTVKVFVNNMRSLSGHVDAE